MSASADREPIAGEPESFDFSTPAEVIAAFVDRVRQRGPDARDALVPLLSEAHAVYAERSANEVLKLRAYAMAAFETVTLPRAALPFVVENLESAFHPYAVAAAAKALRGTQASHPGIAQLLTKGMFNIWQTDKPVSFTSYHTQWPQPTFATALTELFETLGHFAAEAREVLPVLERLARTESERLSDPAVAALLKCLERVRTSETQPTGDGCSPVPLRRHMEGGPMDGESSRGFRDISLEDQDGTRLAWPDFFGQKPTVLGFFYTRCGNPQKCTRTIYNLAAVQSGLAQRGLAGQVRVCAMTYDALFDTPDALRSYGEARGFRFDEDARMFRVRAGFDDLVSRMQLAVSFTGGQVSSHRVEIFVLNSEGRVAHSFVRLLSEPEDLLDALASLVW
ncbi:MAG: SCO family protein [Pseudomonadota bacterium]